LTKIHTGDTVKVMDERLGLCKWGAQLWTRELAREIRTELEKMMDRLPGGGVAIIDAKGVEVFDYSFANELFGKSLLALPGEYAQRFLIVENLTGYTRENLSRALESLNLAMIERKAGKLQLIGKVHPSDQATFSIIANASEPVTATFLKDRLGINVTAVNERLSKLTALALVRRHAGVSPAGRQQYLYSVLS